eukprot:gene16942-12124_t
MSAPHPSLDYTFREFEPVAFPKNCTGDNADESWHVYNGDEMSTMANGNHRDGVTDGSVRQSDYSTVEKPLEEQEYTEVDEPDAKIAAVDDLDDTETFSSFALSHSPSDVSSLVGFRDGRVPPNVAMDQNESAMDVGGSGALLANTAALTTSERSVAKVTVANGNHLFGVTDDIVRKPDNTVVGHRVNDMDVDDGEIIDMDQFLRDQIRMDMELSDRFASGQVSPFAIQHVSQFPLNLSTMDVGGSGALLANTAALATSERSVAKSTVANGNHFFGVTDDIVRKPDNTVVGHRVNDMDVDDGEIIDMDQFLRDQIRMDMELSDRFASGQVSPFAIQHVSQFPLNLSTMDVGGSGALLANTAALATSERSVAKSTVANGECSDTDLPYFMKSPMMLDMGDPGVPRADTVAFATSSDGQSNEASLHAYGDGPYEEEGNDTNMLAPEPTVALSSGLYGSTDYGQSWVSSFQVKSLSTLTPGGGAANAVNNATGAYQAVAMHNQNLFYTTNYWKGGWWYISGWYAWKDVAISSSGQLFVGLIDGQGFYYSTNYGATWQKLPSASYQLNSVSLNSDGNWILTTASQGYAYVVKDVMTSSP